MLGTRTSVALASLVTAGLIAGSGFAQPTEQVAGGASSQPASASVSPAHLQAFADLTGDSPETITSRLARDANLAPLITSAARARIHRKRVGLALTIVGFGILAVGDIVGSAIMLTTPGYPDFSGHEDRFYGGAAIALGSFLVGLALGIPGIVKMVAPTDEEAAAFDHYAPTPSDVSMRVTKPALAPRTFTAPLLSFSF